MFYLFLLFHFVFLLFWLRFWSAPEREFYFNPFVSGTINLTDRVILFLRPVLAIPEAMTALVILIVVVLLQTLLAARLQFPLGVTLGTTFHFTPPAVSDNPLLPLPFTLLQNALFLVRLWTVYLLVRLITPPFRVTRATEALAFFARPFSRIPLLFQPFLLLALHGLIALALTRTTELRILTRLTGTPAATDVSPFLTGPLLLQLLKTGWLAVLSFSDGLIFMTRSLFVLIIGSLGAAIIQSRGLAVLCSEAVDLLLGRFARRCTGAMGFDFTPLIYFFVVDFLYNGICRGLYMLIHSPLFN